MREMDGFIQVKDTKYYFSLKYGLNYDDNGLAVPFNVVIETFQIAYTDDNIIVTPKHYEKIYEQLIERIRQ
jgi:hypothetical protein